MKNKKNILTSALAFFALTLSSCGGGGNALSEQYFEQPTIADHTMTVELLHKNESKWLDVIKQKATTVGISVAEYGAGKKDPKTSFDVALRYSDVYSDDGSYKSVVQNLIDEYDLKYLVSDYYVIPEEESTQSDIVTPEKEDESVTTEQESSEEPISSEISIESKEDVASEETESEESKAESESASEETSTLDPLFPIAYGSKDSLAAKFSFDIAKVLDSVKVDDGMLFAIKVSLQKYENKVALLGSSSYVLSYADNAVKYAVPVALSFDGSSENSYLALGKTLKDVSRYSDVLKKMLAVDAKFAITYKGLEGTIDIDLENTVFVDCEDSAAVPAGAFNVHGKQELSIKLKSK